MSLPPRVVLYDGVCVVCDRSLRWLLDHDRTAMFHFAPLQGATATELRRRHPELAVDPLATLVLVESDAGSASERVYLRSEAVFRIARQLPAPWRFGALLAVLPRSLTDLAYRSFARIRYRVFGRLDQCRVPTTAERDRFLP